MKKSDLKPYRNKCEFMDNLNRVFKKDYGVELEEKELEESANNLTALLNDALEH